MHGFNLGDRVSTHFQVIERTPHSRTAVGRVTGYGYTANTGDPYVEVTWPGPDGGTDLYPPERLVRVYRDADGIPRPIERSTEYRARRTA